MRKLLAGFTLTLMLAALVQAQASIAGKWQGTTRNGMQVLLDLKAEAEVLTGTVTREGEASTITDGKIVKNTIAFKAVLGDQAESLSGEFSDEELRVWLDRQGPEGAVVFKRQKE